MKGIDIFCASQAATSIRRGMDEGSSSSSSPSPSSSSTIYLGGGGRAIDRYNPIIKDPRRLGKSFPIPSCSSHLPINPKPLSESHNPNHHDHQSSKNVAEKSRKTTNRTKIKINKKISSTSDEEKRESYNSKAAAGDRFISAPESSRYLLSDEAADFIDLISEEDHFDHVLKLLPPAAEAEIPDSESNNNDKAASLQKDDRPTCAFKKPISSSSSSRSPDQVVVVVVVLTVSLHCRGCERKMRKHISRMEGVSSFNIDFAAKKVTVVGNVTPLGFLASISKVKNAQLWTPTAVPAVAASSFSRINSSEINKHSQITRF